MEIAFENPDPHAPEAGRPAIHRFSHEAMATVFGIWIRHEDGKYAEQAAWDAFRLLERIETDLNRFEPSSDISRLNAIAPGDRLRLGQSAFECLEQAFAVYRSTGGAFDVTAGGTKDFWNRGPSLWKRFSVRFTGSLPPIGMHHLHLQIDEWTVATDAPVRVDLGAIGKGYAVDRMLGRLAEWDLTDALVHGGASSVAAEGCGPGSRGWPVTLRHPVRKENVLARFEIENRALGASGLEKGAHIIDPATGKPAQRVLAAWAAAPQAAEADAFSTAFMIMPVGDMEACLAKHPELGALVVRRSGKGESIFRHGVGGDKEMEHG